MAAPGDDLVLEASADDTDAERLVDIARSENREAAAVALGRLIRERLAGGSIGELVTAATTPEAQVAAALGVLVEGLRLLPGRVAALDRTGVSAALALAGWEDPGDMVATLLDAILASKGPLVEELARGLASGWDDDLASLLEAAELLAEGYGRSQG